MFFSQAPNVSDLIISLLHVVHDPAPCFVQVCRGDGLDGKCLSVRRLRALSPLIEPLSPGPCYGLGRTDLVVRRTQVLGVREERSREREREMEGAGGGGGWGEEGGTVGGRFNGFYYPLQWATFLSFLC